MIIYIENEFCCPVGSGLESETTKKYFPQTTCTHSHVTNINACIATHSYGTVYILISFFSVELQEIIHISFTIY